MNYETINYRANYYEYSINVIGHGYCIEVELKEHFNHGDETKYFFSITDKTYHIPQFKRFSLEIRKRILTGIWICQQHPEYNLKATLGLVYRSEDNLTWKPECWWSER